MPNGWAEGLFMEMMWNKCVMSGTDGALVLIKGWWASCFDSVLHSQLITCRNYGSVSVYNKSSYGKISWNLEAARFVLRMVRSLWNLTDTFDRQQYCCRRACQISKRCDDLNYQSRGFDTSRDLMTWRLIEYWDGALVFADDPAVIREE